MDERQAFRKLGLGPHSSEAEILNRYHELIASGKIQPDNMAQWESARDTALSVARRNLALPVEEADSGRDVNTDRMFAGEWEAPDGRDWVDGAEAKAIQRLLARHTSSLRTFRILAVSFGILFLALVLHGSGTLSIFGAAIPRRAISVPIFSILAFIGLVYYWMFTSMTRSLHDDIRGLDKTLEDAQGYATLLLDIIPHAARASWTTDHLIDALRRWTVRPPACGIPAPQSFGNVQDFSKRIGHPEFAAFLIDKGLELHVLEKEIMFDDEEEELVSYNLNFTPVPESPETEFTPDDGSPGA